MKKVGLFGGTFDPIHYGHLVLAECAYYECGLDRVIFVPAARPPHKEEDEILESDYRYRMVDLAIQDNPHFEISPLEMRRPGYSYTIDTVKFFLSRYPGAAIFFIMGMDALMEIKSWKDAPELVRLCSFVTAARPGFEIKKDDERLKGLPLAFWESLKVIEVPGHYVSSTELRQRVKAGKPVRYLLPAPVEEYIYEQKFYQE